MSDLIQVWGKKHNLDYVKAKKKLHNDIRESENVIWLLRLLLIEQFDYWYDPCGKSGFDLNRHLTAEGSLIMERLNDIKQA